MEVKTTRYYKKIRFLDIVQYLIAAVIGIGFFIWLLPQNWNFLSNYYPEISKLIIGSIIIQVIISILRLRVLGVFLELLILGLVFLSFLPYAGYFFKFLGLIFVFIELASFQSYQIYQHVDVKHVNPKTEEQQHKKEEKKVEKKEIRDADFEEK